MRSTERNKVLELGVVIAGLVAGVWVLGRMADRVLERLGSTVSEVTEQTARSTAAAVSEAVALVVAPPMNEPVTPAADLLTTAPVHEEPEPFEAYDPTFDLLPDLEDDASRVMVLRPGQSLIPTDDGHRPYNS